MLSKPQNCQQMLNMPENCLNKFFSFSQNMSDVLIQHVGADAYNCGEGSIKMFPEVKV